MIPLSIDQSHANKPLIPVPAQLLPAISIGILVFVNILWQSMQGPMWSRVGHIQEKRILIFCELFDHLQGFFRNEISHVKIIRDIPDGFFIVDQAERIEVIHYPPDHTPVLIKSPVARISFQGGKIPVISLVRHPFQLFSFGFHGPG